MDDFFNSVWILAALVILVTLLTRIPHMLHIKRAGKIGNRYHHTFIAMGYKDARNGPLFEDSGRAHKHNMSILGQRGFFKILYGAVIVMWAAVLGGILTS